MKTPMIKGTALSSTVAFIQKRWGAAVWQAVLADTPEALRVDLQKPLSFGWYQASLLDALFTGIAKHACGGVTEQYDRTFREVGAYIAEDNLGTVYKMVLAMAKPDHLFGLLPRLWTTYFDNIAVALNRPVATAKKGSCIVSGLPVSFVAPAACGWIVFAYRKVGCPDAVVSERGFALGKAKGDPLNFDVGWS